MTVKGTDGCVPSKAANLARVTHGRRATRLKLGCGWYLQFWIEKEARLHPELFHSSFLVGLLRWCRGAEKRILSPPGPQSRPTLVSTCVT